MQNYLALLEGLKEITEKQTRSWNWVRFWQKSKNQLTQPPTADPEQERLIEQQEGPEVPKDIPELVLERPNARKWRAAEQGHDSTGDFYHRLLHVIRVLERDDGQSHHSIAGALISNVRAVRFAVKVGIGASLYAIFAFIPYTRPFYQHWRGEWGLLSYMLVCAMTIGASNTTGWARFIGTFIGAVVAVIVW